MHMKNGLRVIRPSVPILFNRQNDSNLIWRDDTLEPGDLVVSFSAQNTLRLAFFFFFETAQLVKST